MKIVFYNPDTLTCEVQWMWLPTFIGQNVPLMKQLERELSLKFCGTLAEDQVLNAMHAFILEWLDQKLHISGLKEYLEGVKYIQE